jgi:hypothetical protein
MNIQSHCCNPNYCCCGPLRMEDRKKCTSPYAATIVSKRFTDTAKYEKLKFRILVDVRTYRSLPRIWEFRKVVSFWLLIGFFLLSIIFFTLTEFWNFFTSITD